MPTQVGSSAIRAVQDADHEDHHSVDHHSSTRSHDPLALAKDKFKPAIQSFQTGLKAGIKKETTPASLRAKLRAVFCCCCTTGVGLTRMLMSERTREFAMAVVVGESFYVMVQGITTNLIAPCFYAMPPLTLNHWYFEFGSGYMTLTTGSNRDGAYGSADAARSDGALVIDARLLLDDVLAFVFTMITLYWVFTSLDVLHRDWKKKRDRKRARAAANAAAAAAATAAARGTTMGRINQMAGHADEHHDDDDGFSDHDDRYEYDSQRNSSASVEATGPPPTLMLKLADGGLVVSAVFGANLSAAIMQRYGRDLDTYRGTCTGRCAGACTGTSAGTYQGIPEAAAFDSNRGVVHTPELLSQLLGDGFVVISQTDTLLTLTQIQLWRRRRSSTY
mmetsp:Transcript_32572/g.68527  ORF Transcript_32572/g.68527 Transcript_32572/m.68527 type:complete len:391 (+) Transcript_32572:475-1647(+)